MNQPTDRRTVQVREEDAAILAFVTSSALRYCTSLETNEDGCVTVVPQWDPESFATSEKLLWRLLQSLTVGDFQQMSGRLDPSNAAAVVMAVTGVLRVAQ